MPLPALTKRSQAALKTLKKITPRHATGTREKQTRQQLNYNRWKCLKTIWGSGLIIIVIKISRVGGLNHDLK